MSADFIQSLALAHDPRLAGLRPRTEAEKPDLRRDGAAPKPEPTSIDESLRAAVNGGALMSFVAGVSVAQKQDVLYSVQLAQRAASARFDRIQATKDWYAVLADVLERVGWSVEAFGFTERNTSSGQFSLDKSALEIIQTIATGGQLAILVKTLDVLKKLGSEERALKIFELQALAEASGNFQIGAAEASKNGAISLALGAFHFTAADNRKEALFIKWGAQHIRFWTSARKMSLNPEVYAQVRRAVIEKVSADAEDYIARLKVA